MNDHPVRLQVSDDLQRSRLTVFFRLLLAMPHIVWVSLWQAAAVLAVLVNWVVLLATGKPIVALHRFTCAYLRYQTHVYAFVYLLANPFPGFAGTPGTYPVELHLPGPAPQHRGKTFFRPFLALPAYLVTTVLSYCMGVAAVLTWFVALALGREPQGLRDLGNYGLRYSSQTMAYLLLATDRYPFASPLPEAYEPEEQPAEALPLA